MAALQIEVERGGGRTLVRLFGEFDMAGVRPFHRAVADLEARPEHLVVVDLRGLSFIGASGLRSLLELQMRSRRDGFTMTVIKGPPLVHRVFELTGLDDRMVMLDDASDGNGREPVA